jgi:RNA polymerase sigma-70 factor (ECF subfamily)
VASRTTWRPSSARASGRFGRCARIRRRRRDALLVTPGEEPAYVAETDQAELRELLSHLDTDRRAAFALTQLIGLSYDEAAAVCGCPVGTIRSRVARARADLITALDLAPAADPPTSATS